MIIEIILDIVQLMLLGFISSLLLSWLAYGAAYGFKCGLINADNHKN